LLVLVTLDNDNDDKVVLPDAPTTTTIELVAA
jgi:hypothetical protein